MALALYLIYHIIVSVISHILARDREQAFRPVPQRVNFLVEQAGKPVHKRVIENGAISQL